jgi:hypothetical protein
MQQKNKSVKKKRQKTAATAETKVNPEVAESTTAESKDAEKSEATAKQTAVAPVDEPINEKDEIVKLLDEGYSVKQIIDLGFKRRTAYHYAKQRMKPENPSPPTTDQGNGASGKTRQEIIKLGAKDTIPPEAVLEVIHLPQNGEAVEVWRRGVLDGVGMLLLGARYAQLTAAGQAEIVKSQLDVMQEAKDSSRDIAHEAAQQTAMHVVNYLDEKLPKPETKVAEKAGGSDMAEKMFGPMADMFGKQLASILGRSFGGMLGGQPVENNQAQIPEGWQFKKEGGD